MTEEEWVAGSEDGEAPAHGNPAPEWGEGCSTVALTPIVPLVSKPTARLLPLEQLLLDPDREKAAPMSRTRRSQAPGVEGAMAAGGDTAGW
ncbi:Os05g0191600 [Oryza sativa Japonica Group]|uniref:Os05g0191600 protein n=3 Tax=Oryza TaxID=4527 RepID=A0A0P0WJ07_ORYSJ|nr:hypothetical protein [Oryza sativa Japonica Group]EEE62607.1 hypothetical protein OsJ_17410 [Oryza sativa Japonica Group]BAS92644.1 Os05g0191600 [Oryza sativa Japonica Group]